MTEQLSERLARRRLSEQSGAMRWRWVLPLAPIAASMFCLSALVYYHTAMGGAGAPWGFFQGAVVFLYRWLGFVPAFMFWLLLFIWCSIWFVSGRWENVRTRLLWMSAFTLSVAILVNLGTPSDAPPHAGLIGTYIAVRLTSVIGHAAGALLAVAASLASLLLATDFLFYRYFEALARGRATETAGVEPEATEAFRELAFSGLYAEEPMQAASTRADAVVEPPAFDEGLAGDVARALDQDLVVRPRRRRPLAREPLPSAEPLPADTMGEPAEIEREEIEGTATPEILVRDDRDDRLADADVAALPEPVPAEFDAGMVRADPPADVPTGEPEVEAEPVVADAEAVVEIPRGTHAAPAQAPARPATRQGSLFPAGGPRADLDRSAREVLRAGRASVTLLRRHLGCSPGDAMALLDDLRDAGVIDGEPGSPHGRVLTTLAEWEAR